jgi:hypothetical protein
VAQVVDQAVECSLDLTIPCLDAVNLAVTPLVAYSVDLSHYPGIVEATLINDRVMSLTS